MLAAEVRTELVFGNASISIAGALVAVAIIALGSAIIVVHWALLFGRALLVVLVVHVTLLAVALLLFLRAVGFGLSLALVLAAHIWIVVATGIVGSSCLVFLRDPTVFPGSVVVFRLSLILRLIGLIFVAVLRVAASGRNQEQE